MTTETTFFSYSRSDSAFVLRLAKDLREAGENLWLDQLDIEAGSGWDASIQAALNAATRIIVVLSPESVGSDNVMDEVSYALESGKTVIPVLLADCDPPFRLRRLQRIDFTGDYQKGLQKLLIAVEPNAEHAKGDESEAYKPIQLEDASIKLTEDVNERIENNEKNVDASKPEKSKMIYWFGGGAALIALVIWLVVGSGSGTKDHAGHDEDEGKAWNKALTINDSMAYAHYLEHFPNGEFNQLAKNKIDSISRSKGDAFTRPTKESADESNLVKDNSKPANIEPIREVPQTRPKHPLKQTPFYAIMVSSSKTEKEARSKTIDLKRAGNQADYLWIPDYASLSGAEFYSIYIGPFNTQRECEVATEKYRKKYSRAYGLKVSQDKIRVQIYGVGRVTQTKIK